MVCRVITNVGFFQNILIIPFTLFIIHNVCSAEKLTKRNTVLLLHLVSFSAEQTLVLLNEKLSDDNF